MTVLPSPRGTLTPPSDGASRISNSCALRPLRLAGLALAATAAEGTGRAAAGAATTTAATARDAGRRSRRRAHRRGAGTRHRHRRDDAPAPHRRRRGAGSRRLAAGATAGTAGTRGAGTRRAGSGSLRARDVAGARPLAHALRARERVVARARGAGTRAHALRARERVVAGTRRAGTRARGAGWRRRAWAAAPSRRRRRAGVAAAAGASARLAGSGLRGALLGLRLALGDRHRCVGAGAAAGAARRASAGFGGRAWGPGFAADAGRRRVRVRRLRGGPVGLERGLQPARDGGFDGRRGSLDVLAHLLELLKGDLAVDTEFGCDLVYAWFGSHFLLFRVHPETGADHQWRTGLISSRS